MEVVEQYIKERFGRDLGSLKKYRRDPLRATIILLLRDRAHLTWKEIGKIISTGPSSAKITYDKIKFHEEILHPFDKWYQKSKIK